MDGQRFDALAKLLATRAPRRQLFRGLLGSAAGGLLSLAGLAGTAQAGCPEGSADCYGTGECVDLSSDDYHCGSCGNDCRMYDAHCVNYECIDACTYIGLTPCNGNCYDTSSDPYNCGGYGYANPFYDYQYICEQGQTCVDGQCVGCPPPLVDCYGDGQCYDLSSDPNRCGACGRSCASGQCVEYDCVPVPVGCDSGLTDCFGTCVDTTWDANHCGGCGQSCDPNTDDVCCGGDCVSLFDDANHCGECFNPCATGACDAYQCITDCPGDFYACGDICCGPREPCLTDQGGYSCGMACPPRMSECNGECVELERDPLNCGDCSFICESGQCSNYDCVPDPQNPTDCSDGRSRCGDRCCASDEECFSAVCQTKDTQELAPCSPNPDITKVPRAETSGPTTVVVTWPTDLPADSTVEYGETRAFGQLVASPELVTEHRVELTGLVPGQTYHYRARSANACGRDQTKDRTFTTATCEAWYEDPAVKFCAGDCIDTKTEPDPCACDPACKAGELCNRLLGGQCQTRGVCRAGGDCRDGIEGCAEGCSCVPTVDAGVRCVAEYCPEGPKSCASSTECESRFGPGWFCRAGDDGACCGRSVCVKACGSAPYVVLQPTDVQRSGGPRFPHPKDAGYPLGGWGRVPGESVTAFGYGFPSVATGDVFWSHAGDPLATFTVDGTGGFEVVFTVPDEICPGAHTVAFIATDGVGAAASLAVLPILNLRTGCPSKPAELTGEDRKLLEEMASCGLEILPGPKLGIAKVRVFGKTREVGLDLAGFVHQLRQGKFWDAFIGLIPFSGFLDCGKVARKIWFGP